MNPDFVWSTDSISGHATALAHSENSPQEGTEDQIVVLGPSLQGTSFLSAKWVDKRRKAVGKHFYANKSSQISDVLLITTPVPIPAEEEPRYDQE